MKKTSRRTSASRPRSRKRGDGRRQPQRSALEAFARAARALGIRWYVFGAHAVALHGFPRATADLDVTIELGTLSPEAFVRALARRGFAPRFADAGFIRATRVIPVVHRGSAMPIDIVLAGPGLEQVFLASVVRHRLGRQVIPVISREHLIVTKMLAARPKDLEDVRELIAVAGDAVDWAHVDELLVELEQALGQSDLRERLAQLRQR